MKNFVAILASGLFLYSLSMAPVLVGGQRFRRQSEGVYNLPDGADLIVGPYTTNFQCPEKYGYYADIDNGCRLFHICHPLPRDSEDAPLQVQHYTFFCGNETIFDQLSLSCAYPEDSIPCESSAEFFYLNDNFGSDGPSITDEDLARVQGLVARFDQPQQIRRRK